MQTDKNPKQMHSQVSEGKQQGVTLVANTAANTVAGKHYAFFRQFTPIQADLELCSPGRPLIHSDRHSSFSYMLR